MNQRATKWLLMATILITAGAVAALSRAESVGVSVGVSVSESWIRPTLGASRMTAAYGVLTNHGSEADRLVSVAVPGAANVEIHTAGMEDGVMRMRRVEAIDIPGGETVTLAPGGYHVMVMGLADAIAAGTDVEITFTFEKAGPVATTAPASMSAPTGDAQPMGAGDAMGGHAHH